MKEYIVKKQNDGSLLLLNNNGQNCDFSEILKLIGNKLVIAFYGEMGMGKTTLIKSICESLGVKDAVNSPTFAIVNVYDLPLNRGNNVLGNDVSKIYHFDCYRLNNLREAIDMGAEEYFYSGQYCFIEWPQIIETLLPTDFVKIAITPIVDGNRKIIIEV